LNQGRLIFETADLPTEKEGLG